MNGKWRRAGVPHLGWTCLDVEDLGDLSGVCEMCETQEIRYVHFMRHPTYAEDLRCGCACAGYMEGDLRRAEIRDSKMRSASRRRLTWPERHGWTTSYKGNLFIRTGGFRVTIYPDKPPFKVSVAQGERVVFARETYGTVREAQLAGFDKMVWMQ